MEQLPAWDLSWQGWLRRRRLAESRVFAWDTPDDLRNINLRLDAARQAVAKGMHEVEVRVQGAGAGRESAVRAIQSAGIHISVVRDCTPIAHNGCRARKRRRV